MSWSFSSLEKPFTGIPLWDSEAFAAAALANETALSFKLPATPVAIAVGLTSVYETDVLGYAGMVVAIVAQAGTFEVYEGYTKVVGPLAFAPADTFKLGVYDNKVLVYQGTAVVHQLTHSNPLVPTAAAFAPGDAVFDAEIVALSVDRGTLSEITATASRYAPVRFAQYGSVTGSELRVSYLMSGGAAFTSLAEITEAPSGHVGAQTVKFPVRGVYGASTSTASGYTAINPGGKADAAGTAVLTLTSVATSGYIDYAEGVAVFPALETISYELIEPNYAFGNAVITLSTEGEGRENQMADGTAALPAITAKAGDYLWAEGTATFRAITATAQDLAPATMEVDAVAPGFALSMHMEPSALTRVNGIVPTITLAMQNGAQLDADAPSYALASSATIAQVARVDGDAPSYTIAASLQAGNLLSVAADAPDYALAAQTGARAQVEAPSYAITASSTLGIVSSIEADTPGYVLASSVSAGDFSQIIADVPGYSPLYGLIAGSAPGYGLIMEATAVVTPTFTAYAMNTKSAAVTQYSAWEFDLIFRFAGKYYGVADGALYLLEGTTDAGTAIASHFTLPPMDFGTSQMKRMPYVYVGCKSDDKLAVSVTVDEGKTILAQTQTTGRNRRAKLARGLDGRFWSVKVANIAGGYIGIDSVELLPMTLGRKV